MAWMKSGWLPCGFAVLLFCSGIHLRAQAAAEYAGAVAAMGAVGSKATPTTLDKAIIPVLSGGAPSSSGRPSSGQPAGQSSAAASHLSLAVQLSGEDANRKALEDEAGADGGKLLLRSKPTKASVWIAGKRIGSTPLLLMLAPGQYRVELRGDRMEQAEQRIDLQPRETREVVVTLNPRYPSIVRLPKASAP